MTESQQAELQQRAAMAGIPIRRRSTSTVIQMLAPCNWSKPPCVGESCSRRRSRPATLPLAGVISPRRTRLVGTADAGSGSRRTLVADGDEHCGGQLQSGVNLSIECISHLSKICTVCQTRRNQLVRQ